MKQKTIDILKQVDVDSYIFTNEGDIYIKDTKEKINPYIGSHKYLSYSFKLKDGSTAHLLLHQVLAFYYFGIPTDIPVNLLQVDHRDTIRTNNSKKNIHWVDAKGNSNNPLTKEKMRLSSIGRKQSEETIRKRVQKTKGKKRTDEQKKRLSMSKYKAVIQFSLDGQFIKEWSSILEIKNTFGFSSGNISQCCSGNRKSAYGYIWRFK